MLSFVSCIIPLLLLGSASVLVESHIVGDVAISQQWLKNGRTLSFEIPEGAAGAKDRSYANVTLQYRAAEGDGKLWKLYRPWAKDLPTSDPKAWSDAGEARFNINFGDPGVEDFGNPSVRGTLR
jgi:hypothetical protein